MPIKTTTFSFFVSTFLHLAVFCAFMFGFSMTMDTVKYGSEDIAIISSYLQQTPFNEFTENKPTDKETHQEVEIKKEVPTPTTDVQENSPTRTQATKTQKTTPTKQTTQTASQQRSSTSKNNGKQIEALLALLHNAIQNKQHYPMSAQKMRREGSIKLSFILYPNGAISDLIIAKKSSTKSLNSAALSAVNQAAPFKQIDQYLTTPQRFTVNVVFELDE